MASASDLGEEAGEMVVGSRPAGGTGQTGLPLCSQGPHLDLSVMHFTALSRCLSWVQLGAARLLGRPQEA